MMNSPPEKVGAPAVIDVEQLPPALVPFATAIQFATSGTALKYADLSPETPSTLGGILFLLTNLCFSLAGLKLGLEGEVWLGSVVETASVASFIYHLQQLRYPQPSREVQIAILIDYVFAGLSIITCTQYAFEIGLSHIQPEIFIVTGLSVAFLVMGWLWEYGPIYIVVHSLWHVFSALAAFLVGQAHHVASDPDILMNI